MKGYGDLETWAPCVNDPGDPRADDCYICSACGEEIWTDLNLDNESMVLCTKCWELQHM